MNTQSLFASRGFSFWLKPAMLGGAVMILLFLEKRRPLRSQVENKLRHDVRNMTIAGLSALTIQLTEKPLTDRLTKIVEDHQVGLLPRLGLSPLTRSIASVVLLDYTLYLWHVLTHKSPFLWRFHEAHHEDLDLTASTALRFHFGEIGISALWRGAQVVLIGVSRKALTMWQALTLAEIIFHHSNIRLPERLERLLNYCVVTPRMHAIHHSTVFEETNSNWSSGLTVWDRLHGTLKLGVPQNTIEIGVPAYGSKSDMHLLSVIKKPFEKQRKTWNQEQPVNIQRSVGLDSSVLVENTSDSYGCDTGDEHASRFQD